MVTGVVRSAQAGIGIATSAALPPDRTLVSLPGGTVTYGTGTYGAAMAAPYVRLPVTVTNLASATTHLDALLDMALLNAPGRSVLPEWRGSP